jgi:hypothetical protein
MVSLQELNLHATEFGVSFWYGICMVSVNPDQFQRCGVHIYAKSVLSD